MILMPGRSARAAPSRPVEFSYKAQVTDNDDGIILDYAVEYGAAPGGPQLAPAIERGRRHFGRVPRAIAADRGHGRPAFERDLHDLGVRTVAIPRQGKISAARRQIEHSRGFRKLISQMAHRTRRADQLPQARLRLGPHPPGRQERSRDLVRPRGIRPQPGQDRIPGQMTSRIQAARALPRPPPDTDLSPRTFQVEVANPVASCGMP
jgi:transposase, IS5 family